MLLVCFTTDDLLVFFQKVQKEEEPPTANNHAVPRETVPVTNSAVATTVHQPASVANQNATSVRTENSAPAPSQNSTTIAQNQTVSSARQNASSNGNQMNRSAELLPNGIQQSAVPVPVQSSRSLSNSAGVGAAVNSAPRTVVSEQSGQLRTQHVVHDQPPPVPPPPAEVTPPTVEVTPPAEPSIVTKPKTRRQRRPVQNDIPTGDIPSKE